MSDGYLRKREFYGDESGGLMVTAFTAQTTVQKCPPSSAIHVQRGHFRVNNASGGVTWTLQDSAGVVVATVSAAAATVSPTGDFDFGPAGVALTAGADLVFVPSAPGAVGAVSWEAYPQLTT